MAISGAVELISEWNTHFIHAKSTLGHSSGGFLLEGCLM